MVCFDDGKKDVAEFQAETLAMFMAARVNKEIAVFAASMLEDVPGKAALHTAIVAQLVKSLLKVQREHDKELARTSRKKLLAAMMFTTEGAEAVAEMPDTPEIVNIKMLEMLRTVVERYDDILGERRLEEINRLIAEAEGSGR